MKETFRIAIIFLVIGMLIYIGYFVFLGTALSRYLWEQKWILLMLSPALGFSVFGSIMGLLTISIIQIQKIKKYTPVKLTLLIIALIATPAASLAVYHFIDRHNYEIAYTFTPTKWAEADTRNRSLLIDSFREQYDLVGENIDIVLNLLGEPDVKEEFQYTYDLGDHKTPLAFDPYYYLVAFDVNDTITSEGIYQG